MGGSHSTRYGRGGSSNGMGFGDRRSAVESSSANLEKTVKSVTKTSEVVINSIKKITKTNHMFADSVKDSIDALNSANKKHRSSTRAINEAVVKQAAASISSAKAMKDAAIKTNEYVEKLSKLTQLSEKKARIDAAQVELAAIAERQSKLKKILREKDIKQSAGRVAQLKEIVEGEAALNAQIKASVDELGAMKKSITDNTIVFEALDPAVRDVIESNDLLTKSNEEHHDILKKVNGASEDFEKALIGLEKVVEKQSAVYKQHMSAVMDSAKALGAASGGFIGRVVDHFREQLKYNVRESNYWKATMMGMSDGEMSKVLGSNADAIRGITGQAGLNAFSNDNTVAMHRQVQATFGESGAEGLQRIAQLAGIMQASGSSTRDPNVIKDRIASYGASAERVGMSKADFTSFMQGLADSGSLGIMAEKYSGLDPRAAQKALDAEVEARIVNAKMLGLSNKEIEEQIRRDKSKQFAGFNEKLKSILGLEMAKNRLSEIGSPLSKQEESAMMAVNSGIFTADQKALSDKARARIADAGANDLRAGSELYGRTGDSSGFLGSSLRNEILANIGGEGYGFGNNEIEARVQQRQVAAGRYGADAAAYLNGGPASGVLTGPATAPGQYNSSMMIGDQFMNTARTVFDGVAKNPLTAIAANTLGILINTTKMAWWGTKMFGGMGMGGGGAGGLVTGGASRTAGGLAANARFAGASRLAKGGGILSAVTSGIGGWMESSEKGESTGNAASTAAGGAVGGGLGAWGGAAAGAAIGTAIMPVIGTAIGGIIGGIAGGWGGGELGKWVGDGIWDGITGEGDGPAATLERARSDSVRNNAAEPITVKYPPEIEAALLNTARNTEKMVDTGKQQVQQQTKANEHSKSRADIENQLAAFQQNQAATAARYQGVS